MFNLLDDGGQYNPQFALEKHKFICDTFLGGAEKSAASRQVEAGEAAIAEQRAARKQARSDLEPFRQAGETDLEGLGALVTDPEAQKEFISENPFFEALATRSQEGILGGAAAGGKAFAGGTAEALQNSLVLLGADLLNQNITQRQNLANLGQSSAAGQANITKGAAGNISNLLVGQGESQAAGILGQKNARVKTINDAAKAIALCDVRAKENISHVGELNGFPLYSFNYIGSIEPQVNVMAQDVEKVIPEAIIEINGFKHVDMEMVHGWN